MMKNLIAFPGLGIGLFPVYKGFSFFGMTIHWYGILIATGIVLAYIFCKIKAKKREIKEDILIDIILYGLPSAIICARLYYIIFSWSDYKNNLWDVFKVWEGGIAIYGAVIGACLSTLIYCRIKKLDFKLIFDIGAFGLLIGQMLGRWGNFFNAEAYGSETATALFRMQIANRGIVVHPTFLYESVWNLLVFIFLNVYEKHQKFNGEIFLLYLTGYGFGRFFIEGLRQDSLWLGPVRISQIVALSCVVIGLVLIILGRKKLKKISE